MLSTVLVSLSEVSDPSRSVAAPALAAPARFAAPANYAAILWPPRLPDQGLRQEDGRPRGVPRRPAAVGDDPHAEDEAQRARAQGHDGRRDLLVFQWLACC